MTKSSPSIRLAKFLNSNSVKMFFTFSVSTSHMISLSSSNSTSMSVIIVASIFDTIPCSANSITFSCCFPFNSCALAIRFSIEPYLAISILDVFSPIPGIPGMLSAASPHNPKISITCSGRSTSNFSQTSFTPNISGGFPPLPGLYMNVLSLTNCA